MAKNPYNQTVIKNSTQKIGYFTQFIKIIFLNVIFIFFSSYLSANKNILVTGGAGYIGSHTAQLLSTLKYNVIILDNLHHNQTFSPSWAKVIRGDIGDVKILSSIFNTYAIDTVIHLAGFIEVGFSVQDPASFYENNVTKTFTLLDTMRAYGVKKCIFASSCSVLGNPLSTIMTETHPTNPLSPYAKTKLMIEYALQDYGQAYGLRYVVLRFNAAGAYPEMMLGEKHEPETHLIPLLLRAIKNNTPFSIFGTDYDTPDGTCIRDYVHVRDIAQAHVKALDYLDKDGTSDIFNLGSGTGYSVRQIIEMANKVCGSAVQIVNAPRRAGDPSMLVADSTKAKTILGWNPQFSDLETIISSAWKWEQRVSR